MGGPLAQLGSGNDPVGRRHRDTQESRSGPSCYGGTERRRSRTDGGPLPEFSWSRDRTSLPFQSMRNILPSRAHDLRCGRKCVDMSFSASVATSTTISFPLLLPFLYRHVGVEFPSHQKKFPSGKLANVCNDVLTGNYIVRISVTPNNYPTLSYQCHLEAHQVWPIFL